MKGLIHIYTGTGKGKTTCAVGLAVRFLGSGKKVVFTQLMKGNHSSERNILRQIGGCFVIPADKTFGFSWDLTEEERADARICYTNQFEKAVKTAEVENCGMLVLDEIISCYNENMIDRDKVYDFLRNKPDDLEVVLTGRSPEEPIVALADYISDIQKVKHPYDTGVPSRMGIEN